MVPRQRKRSGANEVRTGPLKNAERSAGFIRAIQGGYRSGRRVEAGRWERIHTCESRLTLAPNRESGLLLGFFSFIVYRNNELAVDVSMAA